MLVYAVIAILMQRDQSLNKACHTENAPRSLLKHVHQLIVHQQLGSGWSAARTAICWSLEADSSQLPFWFQRTCRANAAADLSISPSSSKFARRRQPA